MDFTFTASSAAKSNWIRLAISLFFLAAPLSAEGPVVEFFVRAEADHDERDDNHPVQEFFIKDETKAPAKKKTPIRDFFFKRSEDQQDAASEEGEEEASDEDEYNDCDCGACDCGACDCEACECEACDESCSGSCGCCN